MIPKVRAILVCLFLSLPSALADAAVVRGTVTAPGGSLPGAVVSAYDVTGFLRETTTNASGQYMLTLPEGPYRLLAYDASGVYATAFYGGADSYDSTVWLQVVDGSSVTTDFALAAGGKVAGTVSESRGPLRSAVVEAYNLSGTRRGFAKVNALGEYTLVLPAGDYKIFAYDENKFFAGEFYSNVRVFADAPSVRVTPPGATGITLTLEKAGHATVTVVDAVTRVPLGEQTVYAYTAAGALIATGKTENGSYRFTLAPGQYRFVSGDPNRVYGPSFYASGRSFEASEVVTLAAGDERPLTLAAERGAVFTGHVVDVTARLDVAAYNLDGTLHNRTTTNDAGRYDLVVAPGQYKLAVLDPAGAYATQFYSGRMTFVTAAEITAVAGQTLTALDFRPLRAGRFTGVVRNGGTQQALGGVTVAAYDSSAAFVTETTTAPNGTYTLAIAPGTYRLAAFDTRLEFATAYAAGASSYEASVPRTVAADEAIIVDFAMSRGVRVTGTVNQQNGAPIDGVEVFALDASGNRVAGATSINGAFTMVVLPGTYTFTTLDARRRFAPRWIPSVTVGSTSPAPLTFTLTAVVRRRTARS